VKKKTSENNKAFGERQRGCIKIKTRKNIKQPASTKQEDSVWDHLTRGAEEECIGKKSTIQEKEKKQRPAPQWGWEGDKTDGAQKKRKRPVGPTPNTRLGKSHDEREKGRYKCWTE